MDDNKVNEELVSVLKNLYSKLESEQEPLGSEFQKVLDYNFWDLLIKQEEKKYEAI